MTEIEILNQIKKDEKEIFKKHPEDKYRVDPPRERINKFIYENYIDLIVYSKDKKININTYMNLPSDCIDEPEKYKGIVYFFHGIGTHANTNSEFALHFSKKGFVVVSMDYRGHGKSGGIKGNFEKFSYVIEDCKLFILETEKYFQKKFKINEVKFLENRFLAGLSMGGLVSIYISNENPFHYKGVILLSPAIHIWRSNLIIFISKILNCCFPNYKIPNNDKESFFCKNNVSFEKKDELKTETLLNSGVELIKAMEYFQKNYHNKYESPFIIVIPGVDKYVSPKYMYDFFMKSKSLDKEILYYKNCWHSIYAEEEMDDIIIKLENWLLKRV